MRIVAISDTHGAEIKGMPDADLLVHAGDWSGSGTYMETRRFLEWIKTIKHRYGKVVCVPGNHDRWVEANQVQAKREFKDIDVELLIDEGTMHMGANIWGNPWTPEFSNWSFMGDLDKRYAACSIIPNDISILVTHGPPKGYMDKLSEHGSEPGKNVGCEALGQLLFELQPEIWIFGHIHEGHGIMKAADNTLLVNASHMNEYYKPVNGFTVINL